MFKSQLLLFSLAVIIATSCYVVFSHTQTPPPPFHPEIEYLDNNPKY